MAPDAIVNFFPPKGLKLVGEAIDSVTDRSGSPPKPAKSVEMSCVSPEKLVMQLVFTEFGLSPVTEKPSKELSLSSPKPYSMLHSSFPFSLLKQKSQRSHKLANMKTNNAAPKDQKHCRCKQSRCLKLYCECFAAGSYCDGCNCNGCRNNVMNEASRKVAMESILERNPNAFRPKITSSPSTAQDNVEDTKDTPLVGIHNWGCRCKKTGCLKNYCECFHAKVLCSKNCQCVDCKNSEECVEKVSFSGSDYSNTKICSTFEGYKKNMVVSGRDSSNTNVSETFEGCEERDAIVNADHTKTKICKHFEARKEEVAFLSRENNLSKIHVKQANASTSAAIGFSGPSIVQASRKRKLKEFLDLNDKDLPIQRLKSHQKVFNSLRPSSNTLLSIQLVNPQRVSSSLSALSVDPSANIGIAAILGSSKYHCSSKPSFADIIQGRDVEELCSLLVLVSEAAKNSDKNGTSNIQAVREKQNAITHEVQDMESFQEGPNVQKETLDDHLSGNEVDAMSTDTYLSEGIDVKEGRLSSPGTIAVMSNAEDELFTGASKPGQILNHGCNGDDYAEQERLVLASFRDYLKKINILGKMKEL